MKRLATQLGVAVTVVFGGVAGLVWAATNEPEVTQMAFTNGGLRLTITYPPTLSNTAWEIFSYDAAGDVTNSFNGAGGPWALAESNLLLTGAAYVTWVDAGQLGRGAPSDQTNRYYSLCNAADRDGDGIKDGREFLLYGTSYTNADSDGDSINDLPEIRFGSDPNDPASFLTTVAGSVTYHGSQAGWVYVLAARAASDFSLTNTYAVQADAGPYVVSNVPTLKNVWMYAFRDSNSNGVFDAGEAQGSSPLNPFFISGPATDADMEMLDLDNDRDGMSDPWELQHGLDPANPDDAWQDADLDGVPNLYEHRHGSDPHAAASVPADAFVVAPGSNTIQEAVILATGRYDVIRLAPGVYGTPAAGVSLANNPNVLIYGEAGAASTILDGGGTGRCFNLNLQTNPPVLCGLTMRNGFASGGAAVFANQGAGFWILGCVFSRNRATNGSGGAIAAQGGRWIIDRCRFETNSCDGDGGAIMVTRDSGAGRPGMLGLHSSVLVGNRSKGNGAGLFLGSGATATLQNVVVFGNAVTGATAVGGGICVQSTSLFMTNSVVWSNAPSGVARFNTTKGQFGSFGYDIIQGGSNSYTNAFTNFVQVAIATNDPRFRVLDFHLCSNSPCLNGGTSNRVAPLDIDGEARPFGAAMEIGIDEFVDTDADGLPDFYEQAYGDLDPAADLDGDGLSAGEEYRQATVATNADSDADGFSDGDEVGTYHTRPVDSNSLPFVIVFGFVLYDGRQTGTVRIVAATSSNSWTSSFATNMAGPGAYLLRGLPSYSNVWMRAFVDENGNSLRDAEEAYGDFAGNYFAPTNYNVFNVYIALHDVDLDADGMADWWEGVEGFDAANPLDAALDPDADGVPNLFEYRHATGPRSAAGTNVPGPNLTVASGGLTLKRAIDAAAPYDIIHVLPGTYFGAESRDLDTRSKTILVQSPGGPDSVVIDAQQAGRLFKFTNAAGHAALSGLTLRYGSGAQGGALLISNASPWLIDCRFVSCAATSGGGAWIAGGSPLFDRCVFSSNQAAGGGIGQVGGTSRIYNTIFADNAGAISSSNGALGIVGCTFVRNNGSTGSALRIDGGSAGMTNSIVWSNAAGALAALNSAVLAAEFSDVQGGFAGVGNLDANPLFYRDTFHLQASSPCRDAASTNLAFLPDIDRDARPFGGMDMGADEYVDLDGDALPDWWELYYLGTLASSATDDPDGDQVQNQVEYALGTSPGSALAFPTYSISGTILFHGPQNGPIYIYACTNAGEATSRFVAVIAAPGSYQVTNVPAYISCWIRAFRDENGNRAWDSGEPAGAYALNPVVLTGNLAGVDVSFDGDADGDTLPDWWEAAHGLNPADDRDAAADSDGDRVPAAFEYWNNSRPDDATSVPQARQFADGGTNTLQAAIQRVTNDYALVQVLGGTFSGAGWIDVRFFGKKVLVLSATGPRNCVVDGGNNGPVFRLENETGLVAIAGLTIRNARATNGAAIFSSNSSPWLLSCVFASNTAVRNGGAIWLQGGRPALAGCLFEGNSATGGNGGAVFASNSVLDLQFSTFSLNSASQGGAVAAADGYVSAAGDIFWSNGAAGLALLGAATGTFSYCDSDAALAGTGNIQGNPLFVFDGYHLQAGSPCRDAAGGTWTASYDIDGEARPAGAMDIGSDEYRDTDNDGLPDWWENAYGLSATANDSAADLDGDGLSNLQEFSAGSSPFASDTDGDGISDGQDATPLSKADSEPDGLADDWEVFWFGNLSQAGAGDPDADGWNNSAEYTYGLDPTRRNLADTNNVNALGVQRP